MQNSAQADASPAEHYGLPTTGENPSFPLREAMTFLFLDMIYNLLLTRTATEKFPRYIPIPRGNTQCLVTSFQVANRIFFLLLRWVWLQIEHSHATKSWLLASISQEA